MGRQWRQRPIACQSCRRRKIRCSRQFPCSNCTSRGLQCVQFYEPLAPEPEHEAEAKQNDETPPAALTLVSNADIQSRLDRLESWISNLAGPTASASAAAATETDSLSLSRRADDAHAQPLSPPLSSTAQHLSLDALWFGGNFLCRQAKCIPPDICALEVGMTYHILPIRLIKKPYCIMQDVTSTMTPTATGGHEMCLTLPPYREACLIFHAFVKECAILSPLIHVPSLLVSLQEIYSAVEQHAWVNKEHLLLFMAIIASVTYACSPDDDVSKLFSSHLDANIQCATWVSASFALSDELKRRGKTSIVSLQGQNILFKVSSYMEGSSVRTRSLISTSIAMARDLGFHRIDLPGWKPSCGIASMSEMEMESARRLWWDLVIIDWLLALFPGSHEGVYTIHPQHMAVNKPRIIADHETPSAQDQEQQTDVSYFLHRIRLAELSRTYIDRRPLAHGLTDESYQELLHHNQRLEQYQQDLPPFFSLDRLYNPSAPGAHDENSSLVVQRIQINCMVYVMRCIIHLQYLSLSTIESKYAPSRATCFTCASDIVRLHKQVKSQYPRLIPRLKATTFLRSLILASAVFLLDICSGTDVRDLRSERPDMLDAWRCMSDLQEDSNLVEQFFEFAAQMLRKYGVSEAIVMDLAAQLPTHLHMRHDVPVHDFAQYPDAADKQIGVGGMDGDQRWQTLDADFDLKTMSWDNVLWGFDAILM